MENDNIEIVEERLHMEIKTDDIIKSTNLLLYLRDKGILEIKKGESMDFTCPKCGASAHGARSVHDGHLWVTCDSCGVLIYS